MPDEKKEYLGFGGKLNHEVPLWVDTREALFHIRIRSLRPDLTKCETARTLLQSCLFYTEMGRWFCELMLIMPDHLHALIHFPDDSESGMSRIISEWKRYQAKELGLDWQENYFDHRLRKEERTSETADYIRRNPVVLELCPTIEDWPWWISTSPLDGFTQRGWQ